MKHPIALLVPLTVMITLTASQVCAQTTIPTLPGVFGGVVHAHDNEFDRLGWNAGVTLEHYFKHGSLKHYLGVRGTLGALTAHANVQGQHPDASYAYAAGDMLMGNFVSPVFGVGLYHVTLAKPLLTNTQREFDLGVRGGVRFYFPGHYRHAVTLEATLHRVLGDGPLVLVTVGAGFVF